MSEERNIKTVERDRIGKILYILYLLLLVGAAVLIARIVYIQLFYAPNQKILKALTPASIEKRIEPVRGNIIDCNGRLLAMSFPTYQIYMDCTVLKDKNTPEEEEQWIAKVRELSIGLAEVYGDKEATAYYKLIRDGRKSGRKYVKIGHKIGRNDYNRVINLPLFREGRYKSGMIVEQENIRQYPYGKLARRTIGFVRNNKAEEVTNNHVGLEGKFDYILHGREGVEWLRSTDYGRVVNSDSAYVKAIDGQNLQTTINIDYQDIADKALREQIEIEPDLEGGCMVLMEVKTGAIRAMVNLLRSNESGNFEEIQNLAIGRKAEPGSVFKTVTLMSVLNDGFVKSLDQTIPTNHGKVAHTGIPVDKHIGDWEYSHHTNRISVLDGFKISSNYVFGTLAVENYKGKKGANRFIQNIYNYKLGEAFDFDLDGLQTPTIPTPETRYWTDTDLGVMGYGYSTGETPLHIITFYNAIANKGRMMKPYLVNGPSVLNAAICSKAVADTMTRALRAVTEEGTARRLKDAKCNVAGKTGTSFATFDNGKYEDASGRRKYQGTFVGFFPAEDPQYSIICTIYSKPTSKSFQGGGIPAKAIKTVIDKLYNIDPYWRGKLTKAK